MTFNTPHFLRLMDYTPKNILELLKLAQYFKHTNKTASEIPYLTGKNIVLIFEKESTRTRCACEVAAYQQAAGITYLNSQSSQIGHKESIKDTARVLGRFYDAIIYRGSGQYILEELAQHAGIPVCNALTDEFHPTQMIADLLTIQEQQPHKPIATVKLAYLGDGRNNISYSLLELAALTGLDLRIVAPRAYWPKKEFLASLNNTKITLTEDIAAGVNNVDFLYTDVWCSMGESKSLWQKRIQDLLPYQINEKLLKLTNNPRVKLLHCLPALHDTDTLLGKQLAKDYNLYNGIEVTNTVFESEHSIVFEQAENRLHSLKAILVMLLYPQWRTLTANASEN